MGVGLTGVDARQEESCESPDVDRMCKLGLKTTRRDYV
jgi:hypothetical protein